MKYFAEIDVMPHKELLDPQGKTVAKNMNNIDVSGVHDIRIGKHIQMTLEANSEEEAKSKIDTACKKLLSNVIMETYSFTVKPVEA